jgi:hypothetical protein
MQAKGIRIPRICERCGATFWRTPGQLAHAPNRYCSNPCKWGPLEERYWARVQKGPGCWLWTGNTNDKGYGQIADRGRHRIASRVGYELAYGPFDPTLDVLHRCDVPACQRPDHLFLGTHTENMQDMYAKGRRIAARGEAAGKARLTEAQVREIRARYVWGVYGAKRLAKEYGVQVDSIFKIVKRLTWKHLD